MVLFSGNINSFILLRNEIKSKATNAGRDANQSNSLQCGSKQKTEINHLGWLKDDKFCFGGGLIFYCFLSVVFCLK